MRQHAVKGVFLLLRRALGNPLDDKEYEHLQSVDTRKLIRLTTAHSIANFIPKAFDDPAAADCFDADLIGFFQHLREQNRERNRRLENQLFEAAHHLHLEDIPVLALKGAVEFVEPIYDDSADRILSDLDVLVPEDRIDDARKILKANGYTDYGLAYDRAMRHAPPLWREGELTAIELHTAASSAEAQQILPPKELFERSVSAGDAVLLAPSPVDRLCHLVSHAQIDSFRYSANLVLLRDVADYTMMLEKFDSVCNDNAASRFDEAGFAKYFQSFTAVSDQVLTDANLLSSQDDVANGWAKTTTDLLAEPGHHRVSMLISIAAWLWERMSSGSAARRQFLSGLLSPMRIRHFLSRNIGAIRGLQ